MENEKEFKRKLLEEKIYNEVKDTNVISSEKFKLKYKNLDINHYELYVRIVKYQIKKYGTTLYANYVTLNSNKPHVIKNALARRYRRKR